MTNDHDQPKIIRPRFDRRVLLASAAGLGLAAAVGPLPEVWAKGGRRKKAKKPEPIMTKEEQAICDAGIKQWNAYRRQITVGPSDKRAERSPLQEFVLDAEYSQYVRMHIDFLLRHLSGDSLVRPHRGFARRDPKTRQVEFHDGRGSHSDPDVVYHGKFTNFSRDPFSRGMKTIGQLLIPEWCQDVGHGRPMILGSTVSEERSAPSGNRVGIVAKADPRRRNVYSALGFAFAEPPKSRGNEPVIFPEGDKSVRYGRRFTSHTSDPVLRLRGTEGAPVLARFRRVTQGAVLKQRFTLHQVRKKREEAVPGRVGWHLDTTYLVPDAVLRANTQHRIRLYLKIQQTYSDDSKGPVIERNWTREFWTGKNDFGP